jgi:predicted nucleotidyltransferase
MKDSNIRKLAKTAGLASGAEAVYLFGSRTTGCERSESDYDLALLLPDGTDPWQATRDAQRSLWPRSVPIDLVPIARRSWNSKENAFIREIRKDAKLLYSKDG